MHKVIRWRQEEGHAQAQDKGHQEHRGRPEENLANQRPGTLHRHTPAHV
jgi:hypothetical protein